MRTGLAPCSHKKRRMNCICTVSSERCVEDGAATLQPEESTSHVSVLCLQSAVRQATCREHGCRRPTRRMHAICICIISSERCAPGHVSRSGLSLCYQKNACICIMSSERCAPGHVSRSGLSPCYQCPYGTYQPDEGQTVCIKCPNEADTEQRAATSMTECLGRCRSPFALLLSSQGRYVQTEVSKHGA